MRTFFFGSVEREFLHVVTNKLLQALKRLFMILAQFTKLHLQLAGKGQRDVPKSFQDLAHEAATLTQVFVCKSFVI
jgi:hypothetical protein